MSDRDQPPRADSGLPDEYLADVAQLYPQLPVIVETDSDETDDEPADPADPDPQLIRMPPTGSQLATVRPYDGKSSITLWLEHFERQVAQFGWTDVESAEVAKGKLIDEAATWLLAQKRAQKKYNDYQDVAAAGGNAARTGLRTALKRRFSERINELAALEAVSDLNQKETETVDAFYDRCVLAVDKMNFTYTDQQKTQAGYQTHFAIQIFTFFGKGLKDTIRTKTMGVPTPPTTAETLLDAARVVEMELTKLSKLTAGPQINLVQGNKTTLEEQITQLTQQVNALKFKRSGGFRRPFQNRPSSATTRQRDVAQGTCFKCHRPGHIARRCAVIPGPVGGFQRPNFGGPRPEGGGWQRRFNRGASGTRRGNFRRGSFPPRWPNQRPRQTHEIGADGDDEFSDVDYIEEEENYVAG